MGINWKYIFEFVLFNGKTPKLITFCCFSVAINVHNYLLLLATYLDNCLLHVREMCTEVSSIHILFYSNIKINVTLVYPSSMHTFPYNIKTYALKKRTLLHGNMRKHFIFMECALLNLMFSNNYSFHDIMMLCKNR